MDNNEEISDAKSIANAFNSNLIFKYWKRVGKSNS